MQIHLIQGLSANRMSRERAKRQLAEAPAQQRTERGGCEARADPAARCDAAQRKTATADSPTPPSPRLRRGEARSLFEREHDAGRGADGGTPNKQIPARRTTPAPSRRRTRACIVRQPVSSFTISAPLSPSCRVGPFRRSACYVVHDPPCMKPK